MKNIILCEGSTDGILLQYFMRKVHKWQDGTNTNNLFRSSASWFRTMNKGNRRLDITSCKGSSTLSYNLELVLDNNYNATISEAYNKIAIVTDRDEVGTEYDFVQEILQTLGKYNVNVDGSFCHNKWNLCKYCTSTGRTRELELLLLIIPFAQTGAMETFLLNSISAKDPYDDNIIQAGNNFVDNVDPQRKYLTKRRYITKAKFDVYFSVRTAAEQFLQRQNILKDVNWEDYIDIQGEFAKLAHFDA